MYVIFMTRAVNMLREIFITFPSLKAFFRSLFLPSPLSLYFSLPLSLSLPSSFSPSLSLSLPPSLFCPPFERDFAGKRHLFLNPQKEKNAPRLIQKDIDEIMWMANCDKGGREGESAEEEDGGKRKK